MRRFYCSFKGRRVGAIGVFGQWHAYAEGKDEQEALLDLYERFEHITGLTMREVSTEPSPEIG